MCRFAAHEVGHVRPSNLTSCPRLANYYRRNIGKRGKGVRDPWPACCEAFVEANFGDSETGFIEGSKGRSVY